MRMLWLKIINRKNNPIYWPGLVFLWLISLFYRMGLGLRNKLPIKSVKLDAPVISVGNLTVGGSGKTPVVIEIARHFIGLGKKVGIASSGYGRSIRADFVESGKELTDKQKDFNAIDIAGDEVLMMAHILPDAIFSVSESKSSAAQILEDKFKPDIIIVDDGFQHRRLRRDYDLLVIDASIDLRNESLFPLGRLREPVEAIDRASGIALTKINLAGDFQNFRNWLLKKVKIDAIVEVEFLNEEIISELEHLPIQMIKNERIYFFAGIGKFDTLKCFLENQFPNMAGARQFDDHCRYNGNQPLRIREDIRNLNPDYVLTTYKDYIKISHLDFGKKLYYFDLKLNFKPDTKVLFEQLTRLVEN